MTDLEEIIVVGSVSSHIALRKTRKMKDGGGESEGVEAFGELVALRIRTSSYVILSLYYHQRTFNRV